ncbi:hypothetical protein B0H14DRAFT_2709215 [Mycena olivaceomarginata]|nr:hypothetical protein B0H14DRAFT_2709215 [Mycena olivaceomarginata]
MADIAPATVAADMEGQEEEEDWDGDYEEEEEEDDLAAYAAEARRAIEEQLFSNEKVVPAPAPPPPAEAPPNPKEQAAVATVRAILASLEYDSLAQSTLTASKVPEFSGDSLLDILRNIAGSGKIPRGVALPISRFLVTLAKSEVLFGSLRRSDAPSLQLKRKREEADANERANKRLRISNHPLRVEVTEAVRVVSQTITASQTLPGIASIQPQLHRVFMFAVSSSAVPGPNTNALQELGGLIQVLGVLSGTQIGQESQNIHTAVHPCLSDGCGKFFAGLYSLRAHQRVHSNARLTWKCAGCDKSRCRHLVTGRPPKYCPGAAIPKNQRKANWNPRLSRRHRRLSWDCMRHCRHTLRARWAPPPGSRPRPQLRTLPTVRRRSLASAASLSMYGLSDEQTKQVKEAITNAASAAQAEAEAQAALEEDEENDGGGSTPHPPA